MASRSNAVVGYDRLRLCNDFGSSFNKMAVQHAPANTDPDAKKIQVVQIFGSQEPVVEQSILYDDQNGIHWGRVHVGRWRKSNPKHDGRIMERFKLALCEQFKDSPIVERLYALLGVKHGDLGEVQELITDIFQIIKRQTLEFMKHKSRANRGLPADLDRAAYWDNIHTELSLPLPHNWTGKQYGIMKNAAHAAGYQHVIMRSEPLCAASAVVLELWFDGSVVSGDVVLVIDWGHATVVCNSLMLFCLLRPYVVTDVSSRTSHR